MLNKLIHIFRALLAFLRRTPSTDTRDDKPDMNAEPRQSFSDRKNSPQSRNKSDIGITSNKQASPSDSLKKDNQNASKSLQKTSPTSSPTSIKTDNQKTWSVEEFKVPLVEGKTRFHELNLDDRIMHAISDLGYQYCSPIQAESLPVTLTGRDVIGKAQTGTGKTAAFLITILQYLLKHPIALEDRFASEPRALIIAPTRELAMQIESDAIELIKYSDLCAFSVVGGLDYQTQKDFLLNNVIDILVATPGRLIDFLNSKDVYLDQVEILVLDEADRMLDMGFIPDVKRIIRHNRPIQDRQTLLFSATFNQDVLNLSNMWTENAGFIEIEPETLTTDRVDQKVFMVSAEDKLKVICNYLTQHKIDRAIIFGNRRDETRRLEETLKKKGFSAALLSGEVPQTKRVRTLENFKSGKIKILVATDVAGRGIHVDNLSHVFNYNLPDDPEDYVHRIGRTGRAGENGTSISFACEDDAFLLPELEKFIGMKLPCEYPDSTLLNDI